MKILTASTVLMLPLALAACVENQASTAVSRPDSAYANWPLKSYKCADNQPLDIRFAPDGDHVTIDQMGERILMKQVSSASGVRYQAVSKNYTYSLDTKGDDANLYEGGDKIVLADCRPVK